MKTTGEMHEKLVKDDKDVEYQYDKPKGFMINVTGVIEWLKKKPVKKEVKELSLTEEKMNKIDEELRNGKV